VSQLIPALSSLYLPQHIVLTHPSIFSSFKVRQEFGGTYLTTSNTVVLYISIMVLLEIWKEDERCWIE